MNFTGERFVSALTGGIQHTHHHRYLAAMQLCAGKHVLDVACGEGYGAALIGDCAASVVGVDVDRDTVQFARDCYGRDGVSFMEASAESLPFPDDTFDVVVSFETIKHLRDAERFLDEVRRVLKADGVLVISSPNKNIYSGKDGYDNPFHVRELTPAEFREILDARFKFIEFYAQERVTGSIVAPMERLAPPALWETADGQSYTLTTTTENPRYIIAIASHSALDVNIGSVLTHTTYASTTSEHLAYYKKKYEELQRQRAEVDRVRQQAMDVLKQRLATVQTDVAGVRKSLKDVEGAVIRQVADVHQRQWQQLVELGERQASAAERGKPLEAFAQEALFPAFYALRYAKLRVKSILWWVLLRRNTFQYAAQVSAASTEGFADYVRHQEARRAARKRLLVGRLKHPLSREKRGRVACR